MCYGADPRRIQSPIIVVLGCGVRSKLGLYMQESASSADDPERKALG